MDDLLDLNFSNNSQTSKSQPQYKGASFDYLAGPPAGQSSSSNTRAQQVPNPVSRGPTSAGTSPLQPIQPQKSSSSGAPAATKPKSNQDDAFSSLFGSGAPAKDPNSLSMAERLQASSSAFPSASSSRSQTPINAHLPQRTSDDPWDFDMMPAKKPSPQPTRPPAEDDFGFGFDATPQTQPPQAPAASDDFELAFGDPPTQTHQQSASRQNGHPQGQGLFEADEADTDDVLGELGELGKPPSRQPTPQTRLSPESSSSSAAAPPPHVLGQLVEMGFNVPEAQQALAATYDAQKGTWDVQAAAEQILAISVPDQDQPPSRPGSRGQRGQSSRVDEDPLPPRPSGSPSNRSAGGDMSRDQLVSQASALGNSMFKMANSYWKAGNKAFKQALDQRAAVAAQERASAGSGSSGQDARPKWMRDLPPDVQIEDLPKEFSESKTQHQRDGPRRKETGQPKPSLFEDDVLPPHPSERKAAQSSPSQQPPSAASAPAQPAAPWIYQSSARRKVPQRSAAASPAPQQPPVSTASSPRPPKPKIVYQRAKIPLPPTTLAASSQHRTKGNEHFKLGAYADAEAAYTLAVEVLPEQHLAAILPLNNRANARLKNGNERGSIEDSSVVLRLALCLTSEDLSATNVDAAALDSDTTSINVPGLNLREAVGKALGRRAQAYETAEKWQSALSDWELLMQAGAPLVQPAGGTRIVSDGLTRCRKALAPKAAPARNPAAPKKPAPVRPLAPGPSKDSEALQHVRAAAQKAEADDAQRLASKDQVDARIAAWKGGKENNLRALISSLDMVVWPELGWKAIGMHELISENKLKINYTKAIAKLHPDKLNAMSTTVEQRMLAANAFAALNDAWNASRS